MLCDHSWTVQTLATLKFTITSSPSRLIAEGVNSKYNRTPRPIAPPRALCAFQTHRTLWSGFPSLTTMLKNHFQPCDDQGVLCYATSPRNLWILCADLVRSGRWHGTYHRQHLPLSIFDHRKGCLRTFQPIRANQQPCDQPCPRQSESGSITFLPFQQFLQLTLLTLSTEMLRVSRADRSLFTIVVYRPEKLSEYGMVFISLWRFEPVDYSAQGIVNHNSVLSRRASRRWHPELFRRQHYRRTRVNALSSSTVDTSGGAIPWSVRNYHSANQFWIKRKSNLNQ
jgi:hypothetical protein